MASHSGLKGVGLNVALLMLLCILQGIIMGLAMSIPYLLQSRDVSYKEQAVFSFVSWPFSLKLLWAPLVDSIYLPAFGRRKSWLVPTQYLIGIFMFILSCSSPVRQLTIPTADVGVSVDMTLLTGMFFVLTFLAATQDIAVGGWALTLLSKKNVGWVATWNTVGGIAGIFVGNVIFLWLESADFCNKYIYSQPKDYGLITLDGFLKFWSAVFIIVATLLMLIKHETDVVSTPDAEDASQDASMTQSVAEAYMQLWKIVHLPAVLSLIVTLLTIGIGFAAERNVTGLKQSESGVPRENLALMAVPLIPITITVLLIVTRYTSHQRPLDVLLQTMPFRLVSNLLNALLVWCVPYVRLADNQFPAYFYVLLFLVAALNQAATICGVVTMAAFFAKVSDSSLGGTYMALLNTVAQFGGSWPSTVALWLIDSLTWTGCTSTDGDCISLAEGSSSSCVSLSQSCIIHDGYYTESLVCFAIGFIWLFLRASKVRRLQDLPPSSWVVSKPSKQL